MVCDWTVIGAENEPPITLNEIVRVAVARP